MTDEEFIDELSSRLRVGPRARRRILLEVTDHLREAAGDRADWAAPGSETDVYVTARLGRPRILAEEFNRAYSDHRHTRVLGLARVAAVGFGLLLAACALLLSGDFDGDRNFSPEFFLVGASVAVIAVCMSTQRFRLLAAGLGMIAVGWLAWSLHLVTNQAGAACVVLLVLGMVGATVSDGFARSLKARTG